MIPIEDRAARVLDSAKKIESPFAVDPSLCLYSPQDNVDSLQHPRILEWLKFVREDYTPKLPESQRRILLFMPCTRTKPYPFSTEHQAINQRLLDSGFQPTNHDLYYHPNTAIGPAAINRPITPPLDGKVLLDQWNLACEWQQMA